ncbi:MAG: hypothetical protein ACLPVY_02915 [Acidimicrobiia bacterium]
MEAEGWYQDPYGLHDERWYSNGTATSLVRDARVESKDPPPPHPPASSTLSRKEAATSSRGSDDVRRADDAEQGASDPNYGDAAFDSIGVVQSIWDPFQGRD